MTTTTLGNAPLEAGDPSFPEFFDNFLRWFGFFRVLAWLIGLIRKILDLRNRAHRNKGTWVPLPVVTGTGEFTFGRSDAGAW